MNDATPTSELFRRYLRGDLTAAGEAELERRAAADTELAGALAAVNAAAEIDHPAHVGRMLERAGGTGAGAQVEGRIRKSGRGGRPAWSRYAVAAGLLLLIGLTVFWWPAGLLDSSDTVAMAEPPPVPNTVQSSPTEEPAAPTDVAAEAFTEPDVAPASALEPQPTPANDATTARTVPRTATPRPAPAPPPPRKATVEAKAQAEVGVEPTTARASTPPPPPAPAPRIATERIAVPTPLVEDDEPSQAEAVRLRQSRTVSGTVSDPDGRPLAGARLTRPGDPLPVRTDSLGRFTLPADATLNRIDISLAGYEREEVTISPSEEGPLDITLVSRAEATQNFAPGEIFGANTTLTRDSMSGLLVPRRNVAYATPKEGFRLLKRRIETQAPAGLPPGKVHVSFLVDPIDGGLSDFKFYGRPERAVMDYVGTALVEESSWTVEGSDRPVRVHLRLRFGD